MTKRLTNHFLYWLFFGVLSLLVSWVSAVEIERIEISGNNVISRGTVLDYLPVGVGDAFNAEVSEEVISRLFATSFFRDIDVKLEDAVLRIQVEENPAIRYIEVEGYSKSIMSDEVLEEILRSEGLVLGNIFNKRRTEEFVTKLKNTYSGRGYYNALVEQNIEVDEDGRVGIEILIDEGRVARIRSMRILGAEDYDEDDLLDLFDIGEPDPPIINFFTKNDRFSQLELDAGVDALTAFYIGAGYLDFEVSSVDTQLSQDKTELSVQVAVEEGEQYTLSEVNFSGDFLHFDEQELVDMMGLSVGDVYEGRSVSMGIARIGSSFADLGYAFAKISPLTQENVNTSEVVLTVNIDSGSQIYVNRIEIEGNTRTQDSVVRRVIEIDESSIFSGIKLRRSLNNIRRLGYFADLKMDLLPVEGADDKVDVSIVVEERKTGSITFGVSHSSGTGLAYSFGISESNFLGTGNTLNARVEKSQAVSEANLFFKNPFFNAAGHSLNYGFIFREVDGSELSVGSYEISTRGLRAGYGVPTSLDTRINFGVNYSIHNVNCGLLFATSDFEQAQCASDDEEEVLVTANWSNNTLNDAFFPSDGQRNTIGVEVALPIGDFRYARLNASHNSYYRLNDDWVTEVSGKIGIADGYDNKPLPFFKRYYGGGSNSVRGFEFNSIGSRYPNGDSKGGGLSVLAGVSAITPVPFVQDSSNMRLSVFVDAGGIYDNVSDFEVGDFRVSTGAAFSWLTPIGPLNLYYALPLVKKSGDDTRNVEFTLGLNF